MVRAVYLLVYAALAGVGAALVARPARFFVESLGLRRAVVPWLVWHGELAVVLLALVAGFTLAFAAAVGLGKKPRVFAHAGFLALLGACMVYRNFAPEPQPPRDATPALLAALREAGVALDAGYKDGYDAQAVAARIAALPSPFVFRGRPLALRARVVADASGAQTAPLAGDEPGSIYVAVAPGRERVWLTALGVHGVVSLRGKPAVLEARKGTHALPGQDPDVPVYPEARPLER